MALRFLRPTGVVVTTSRPLRAQQQQAMPTVGVVLGPIPRHLHPFAEPFVRYMQELGWKMLATTESSFRLPRGTGTGSQG
jgi:hypothetical protein